MGITYKTNEIGRVIEVAKEFTTKKGKEGARVKTIVAFPYYKGEGEVEIRETELYLTVFEGQVDDSGYIKPAVLADKMKPRAFVEIDEYKAQQAAQAEPEPAQA